MREQIRERLREMSEKEYGEFSASLIPGSKPLLGVRLPLLRKLARELVGQDWRAELGFYEGEYEDLYFEETMLRGMMIGYGTAKGELKEGLSYVAVFIPHIDNWSVCDSFCNSFLLADRFPAGVWEFLQRYLYSDKEFEVRTALVTLLCHFLKYSENGKKSPRKRVISLQDLKEDALAEHSRDYPYIERVLDTLNREFPQGYYAQMAAAWTVAEAFVTFPFETLAMLDKECRMDKWTYNKALQKICESRIPDDEVKREIRGRKRF